MDVHGWGSWTGPKRNKEIEEEYRIVRRSPYLVLRPSAALGTNLTSKCLHLSQVPLCHCFSKLPRLDEQAQNAVELYDGDDGVIAEKRAGKMPGLDGRGLPFIFSVLLVVFSRECGAKRRTFEGKIWRGCIQVSKLRKWQVTSRRKLGLLKSLSP